MKTAKLFLAALIAAVFALTACNNSKHQLTERALQLCQYIPDHKLLPEAKQFMTEDFYNILSEAFAAPSLVPMDNEWLNYFVTGNGGTIPQFTIEEITQTDKHHASARIIVKQMWEDGSVAAEEAQEHIMLMERINGKWLISNFDDKKNECINYLENCRKEQTALKTISDYLTDSIASYYLQGEVSIPCIVFVAVDEDLTEDNSTDIPFYGDFWVFNYNISGDTLLTVSGGSHPGCIHLTATDGKISVKSFDRVTDGAGFLASAKRIFGNHFELFEQIQSNESLKDEYRKQSIIDYAKQHNLNIRYYKDFGWPAVDITQ